jgi:hypothetical protein
VFAGGECPATQDDIKPLQGDGFYGRVVSYAPFPCGWNPKVKL